MEARTVAEVERWESRPFSGGYDGLHDLASGEFSGAVVAGDGYLFMVAGRVIGVFDYDESATGEVSVEPAPIDRFEDAQGTAYTAPHDALALLYAMAGTGGDVRGRYYTQKTAIEEVDQTLREGGFTGYLELSENVLSGDYYLVYHRGRRRAVAFVGQSRRLRTDEEAFDLANDEVGIYEVTAVRLSTAEIPGDRSHDGVAVTDPDVDESSDDEPAEEESAPNETAIGSTPERPEIDLDAALNPRDESEGPDETTATDESGAETDADVPAHADADGGTSSTEPAPIGPSTGPTDEDRTGGEDDRTGEDDGPGEPGESDVADGSDDPMSNVASTSSGEPTGGATGETSGEPTGEATQEDIEAATAAAEAELESEREQSTPPGERIDDSRVVPSIDPERTARATGATPSGTVGSKSADGRLVDGETVAGLRSELSARESRIEELRERLDAVATERDGLRDRVAELERRLEESGAAPLEARRELSPAEALAGTTVLIGYGSRAAPTLADAHDGAVDRDALAANLVLETHTTFDTDDVAVSGRTFDAFFEESQGYRFLRWLIGSLLYEIQETGNVDSLEPLYEALPSIHRVEFDTTVTLEWGDRETVRFDLVGRDDQGNPLFVAHLSEDRAPTTGTTVAEFLTDATAAAETHPSLVAAFCTTASYFEEEARQAVSDATGTSLLSRNRRKSFVSTSRKGGYHLCLVRDREDSFYLAVPDL